MRYNDVCKIPSITIKEGICPDKAKLTIAIPTYKRSHLLKETLESCLAQKTTIPFAIIVVDNNPERNCETEQLIQKYNRVPNLSYYKNTKNLGMAGNWNKLFELSKTDFVVMLHDDDLLYDDYIEKVDFILKKNNYDVNTLFLDMEIFEKDKEIKARKINRMEIQSLKPFDFQFGNIGNIAGAVFNKATLIKLDGFNNDFYPSFDYELYVRLSFYGKVFKIYGYYTLYRILENESTNIETVLKFTNKDKEIMFSIIKGYPKLYKSLFKHYINSYEKYYIIWNKSTFHTNDPKLDEYFHKKEEETNFFDDFIFKIGSLIKRFSPVFRKSTI
jgi:glycosyltransferase, group 2 family